MLVTYDMHSDGLRNIKNNFYLLFLSLELRRLFLVSEDGEVTLDLERDLDIVLDWARGARALLFSSFTAVGVFGWLSLLIVATMFSMF